VALVDGTDRAADLAGEPGQRRFHQIVSEVHAQLERVVEGGEAVGVAGRTVGGQR
jgi:hypothetical protein